MRIVSQDKRKDYPYEQVQVGIDVYEFPSGNQGACIYVTLVGTDLGDTIGTYGSEKRALEVMEEIRTAYTGKKERKRIVNDFITVVTTPPADIFKMPEK